MSLTIKKVLPKSNFVLALTILGGFGMGIITNPLSGTNQKVDKYKYAYFAGGCFWCVEEAFEAHQGVLEAESGYMGGHTKNPSYKEVTTGDTGHYEAVRVIYDPDVIKYDKLLDIFWLNIDPTQGNGQFCDNGSSYRSAIFYQDETEQKLANKTAQEYQKKLLRSGEMKTEIISYKTFYLAEDYHQNYYRVNPIRYKYYKYACGREKRLKEVWGNYYQKKS